VWPNLNKHFLPSHKTAFSLAIRSSAAGRASQAPDSAKIYEVLVFNAATCDTGKSVSTLPLLLCQAKWMYSEPIMLRASASFLCLSLRPSVSLKFFQSAPHWDQLRPRQVAHRRDPWLTRFGWIGLLNSDAGKQETGPTGPTGPSVSGAHRRNGKTATGPAPWRHLRPWLSPFSNQRTV
jgi:hypothetical protein